MQDPYGYRPPEPSGNGTQQPKIYTQEKYDIELLKSYKELLDCGIITQEEFDAKKNELLHKKRQAQQPSTGSAQQSASTPQQPTETAQHTQSWQPQKYDELFQQPSPPPSSYRLTPEYEATRICVRCGNAVPSSEQTCPFCEIRDNAVEVKRAPKKRGMKWNKFICVLLLLSGIFQILCALVSFFIGIGAESPAMFIATGVFIVLTVFAFSTREALDWNKKRGPVMLFFYFNFDLIAALIAVIAFFAMDGDYVYVYEQVVSIGSDLLANAALSVSVIPTILLGLGAVLFVKLLLNILNFIYYFKRRHVFVL